MIKIKNSGRKFLSLWFISLLFMSFIQTNGALVKTYEPLVDGVKLHLRFNEPATASPLSLATAGDTTYDELYLLQDTVIFEDCEITDFDRAIDVAGSITYSNAGTLDVVTMPSDINLATTVAGALQTYQDHLESANKAYDDETDFVIQVWEQDIEARTYLTSIASSYSTGLTYLNISTVQYWLEIDYNEAACDSLLDEVLNDEDFKDLGTETTVSAADVGEVIEDYLYKYSYDFGISIWNETTLGSTLLTDRLDTWADNYANNFTEVNSYNHMLSNIISAYGHRIYSPPSGYELDKMIDTSVYGNDADPNSYFRLAGDEVFLGIQIDSLMESAGVAIDNILAAVFQIVPESVASQVSGYVFIFILFLIGMVIVAWKQKKLGVKTGKDWFVMALVVLVFAYIFTLGMVEYTAMTW